MISIKVRGVKQAVKKLQVIRGPKLRSNVQRAMNKIVLTLERDIKKNFTHTKALPKYRGKLRATRDITGITRRYPSEPGEPPANQTGQLRAAIKSQVLMGKSGKEYFVTGIVGAMSPPYANKDYGVYNELGTGQRGRGDALTLNPDIYGGFGKIFNRLKFSSVKGMQRRPYLQPVYEHNKIFITQTLNNAINKNFDDRI
jgi:hypothetical protein